MPAAAREATWWTLVESLDTYLRLLPNEKTLILVNNRDDAQKVSIAQARGYFGKAKILKNLLTGTTTDLKTAGDIDVPGNEALILGIE